MTISQSEFHVRIFFLSDLVTYFFRLLWLKWSFL